MGHLTHGARWRSYVNAPLNGPDLETNSAASYKNKFRMSFLSEGEGTAIPLREDLPPLLGWEDGMMR